MARITRRALVASCSTLPAAALSAGVASDDGNESQLSDKRDVVIRDTDHIRTYYKLARS